MSFSVISLFSGCGGSSLGYKLAGGEILLASDWDKNAADTYQANFPNTPFFHGNINDLSIEQIYYLANIKKFELDILDGSPPCQGFSTTGKRNFNDKRNVLFKEYIRILKGLSPKTFVMENVSGMIKGNMKYIFTEILQELKVCGYQVKAKLLNAKNYNVSQSRQRIIFIGVRKDIEIEPLFPIPSKRIITFKEAVKNCPNGERISPAGITLTLSSKLKQGENGSKYNSKKHYFSTYRVNENKCSNTITKTFSNGRSFVFHPHLNQSLSIEEVKRLFSFPDDYIFLGKFTEKWARLGNCVPPNFMKAIASNIYENILRKINGS